jgi:alkaline phosphatase D
MTTSRRSVLAHGLALAGAAALPSALLAAPKFADNPFRLGVSSGFPTDHSVVLWTRLAPDPMAPGGGMPALDVELRWEIAADEGFRHVLKRGHVRALAQLAHSARVEVQGLPSAQPFWYRFTAGGQQSTVGRTHTLPAAHAKLAALRLAVLCCQHY